MNRTDAICLIVVVLVIVAIVSALTYSWYLDANKKAEKKEESSLLIREGDLVTFHFTEYIYTKDASGKLSWCVYQTTMDDVVADDSIPKSVTFQDILLNDTGSSMSREQITAIVGDDVIAEINFGFNNLLKGLKEGESITGYEIPKTEGYGEKNNSLIETIQPIDNIPMYETIDRTKFEQRYPEEFPLETNQIILDHYWGWTNRVESITDDTVVIKHEPDIGMELTVFNWPCKVVNISSSSGLIWIQHKPDESIINTPLDIETLEFYNQKFTEIKEGMVEVQQPYPGIILSINNGIELDFNRENIGKSLKYDITIIEIERD